MPAPHHSLQARCPSCHPTNSVKSNQGHITPRSPHRVQRCSLLLTAVHQLVINARWKQAPVSSLVSRAQSTLMCWISSMSVMSDVSSPTLHRVASLHNTVIVHAIRKPFLRLQPEHATTYHQRQGPHCRCSSNNLKQSLSIHISLI